MSSNKIITLGAAALVAGALLVGTSIGQAGPVFAGVLTDTPTPTETPTPTDTPTPTSTATRTATSTVALKTHTPTPEGTAAATHTPAATNTPQGGAGAGGLRPPSTGTGDSARTGYTTWAIAAGMLLALGGGSVAAFGAWRRRTSR